MSQQPITQEQLRAVFVNPDIAKKVVDAVVPAVKKPKGWSRKSIAAYYSEDYAVQIKREIDAMLADRQDRLYLYSSWPHMAPQSVYLRVNQSLRYLVDYMDLDGVYRKAIATIAVTRDRIAKGVRLSIKPEFRDTGMSTFMPAQVVPSADLPKWKQKIDRWVEDSKPGDKPFVLQHLALTPDEVRDLKTQFAGLRSVLSSITATAIKLIKVNPPAE